jgi:iron complex outermembrane receptor protein
VGFIVQIVNSGDVDLYGAELDGQMFLTDNLSVFGSYAWSEYDLHDPVTNFGPFLFPEPPTHSGAVGALFNQSLGANGDLDWSLNYNYVGEMETHPTDPAHAFGDSSYTQPSYGLVNGRVEWTHPDGRYSVALFANNLLDETYAAFSTRFGGGYWDVGGPRRGAGGSPDRTSRNVVRGQPRQVGVTVQVNF